MIKIDSLTKAQLASAVTSVLLVIHAFTSDSYFIPSILLFANFGLYLQLVKFEKTQKRYKKLCRRAKSLGA